MERDPQKDLNVCAYIGAIDKEALGCDPERMGMAFVEFASEALPYWIRRAEELRERYNAASLELEGLREQSKLKLAKELEDELGTADVVEAVQKVREMKEALNSALKALTEGMEDIPAGERSRECARLRAEAKRAIRRVMGHD